jgi:hypothetical protein
MAVILCQEIAEKNPGVGAPVETDFDETEWVWE